MEKLWIFEHPYFLNRHIYMPGHGGRRGTWSQGGFCFVWIVMDKYFTRQNFIKLNSIMFCSIHCFQAFQVFSGFSSCIELCQNHIKWLKVDLKSYLNLFSLLDYFAFYELTSYYSTEVLNIGNH